MRIKKFNEHLNTSLLVIDENEYEIKKAEFNLDKFDEDGYSDEYPFKSYVVIDEDQPPRVRVFDGVFDDNNHRMAFDPLNYSEKNIHVRLKHGDECYIDELYDIVSTTNKTGSIKYDYLDEFIIHEDLKNIN